MELEHEQRKVCRLLCTQMCVHTISVSKRGKCASLLHPGMDVQFQITACELVLQALEYCDTTPVEWHFA